MRLNYTKTVRALRIAIPTLGVLLLLSLILWPYITHIALPHLDKAEIHGDRLVMINPNYHSLDGDENPYNVSAARAIQYRDKPDIVTLEEITGQLSSAADQKFALRARGGTYDRKQRTLDLNGHVVLQTADGSNYTTETMHVDLEGKIASSNDAVTGQGADRTVTATGFDYQQTSGLLRLHGPARLILHSSKDAENPVKDSQP